MVAEEAEVGRTTHSSQVRPPDGRRLGVAFLDRIGFRQLILLIALVPMVVGNLATLQLAFDAREAQQVADAELGDLERLVALGNYQTAIVAELALYRGWPTVLGASSIDENDPTITSTRIVLGSVVTGATDLAASGVRGATLTAGDRRLFDDISGRLDALRATFAADPSDEQLEPLREIDERVGDWSSTVETLAVGRSASWTVIEHQAAFATALSAEVIAVGGQLLAGESSEEQRREVALRLAASDDALDRLLRVATPDQQQRLRDAFAQNDYLSDLRSDVADLPDRFEPLDAPGVVGALSDLAVFTEVTVQVQAESITAVQVEAFGRSASAERKFRIMIAAAVATLVVPGLLVLVIGRRTTRRVRTLAQAAERLSLGELGVQADDVGGTDELALLAEAFNAVSSTVLVGHDQIAALADGRLDDPVLEHDLPGPVGHTLRVALRRLGNTTAELTHHASHDRLTGLLDRRGFHLAAESLSTDRQRSMLLIDLDGFKAVNDQHGHAAGDAVLEAVADCLRRCTRAGDLLARLGGDEFVVVAERAGAQRLAKTLGDEIARPVPWQGDDLQVTSSIGWTTLEVEEPFGLALARADAAMYRAKRSGRHRVEHVERGEFSASDRAM